MRFSFTSLCPLKPFIYIFDIFSSHKKFTKQMIKKLGRIFLVRISEKRICFTQSTNRFDYPNIPTVWWTKRNGKMEMRSLPSRARDEDLITVVSVLSLAFHHFLFLLFPSCLHISPLFFFVYIGNLYLFS